ncbi:hypothetical protein, partial [Bacteroides sp. HMSC068A09]|uniref:hypothetical protein n=1 Tax=Bacteroides sp. HMSC068A09 TaxID=1739319 RepID=UPI001AEF9F35
LCQRFDTTSFPVLKKESRRYSFLFILVTSSRQSFYHFLPIIRQAPTSLTKAINSAATTCPPT